MDSISDNKLCEKKDEQICFMFDEQQCTLKLAQNQSKLAVSAVSTNELLVEFDLGDVIGIRRKEVAEPDRGGQLLTLYVYSFQGTTATTTVPDTALRERKVFDLHFFTSEKIFQDWYSTLSNLIHGTCQGKQEGEKIRKKAYDQEDDKLQLSSSAPFIDQSKQKFLVLINPKSGNGHTTLSAWQNTVQIMLDEANIIYDVLITQSVNHAKKMIYHSTMLSEYSVILILGGDGTINEVMNGIAVRKDKDHLFKTLRLAPIPCGSGNGMIKSILYECQQGMSVINATFLAIKGHAIPVNTSLLHQTTSFPLQTHLVCLSIMWGLIADIDIFSESMRWLGELRFFLAAVYYIFLKRVYIGQLRMKLSPICTYQSTILQKKTIIASTFPLPSDLQLLSDADDDEDEKEKKGKGCWVCLDSAFLMIAIIQTSHITATTHFGPEVRLSDGMFTIYCIDQTVSRYELLKCMLALETSTGGHVYQSNNNVVRIFQCTEYELIPSSHISSSAGAAGGEAGIFSVDGEVMPAQPIRGKMLPLGIQFCSTMTNNNSQ